MFLFYVCIHILCAHNDFSEDTRLDLTLHFGTYNCSNIKNCWFIQSFTSEYRIAYIASLTYIRAYITYVWIQSLPNILYPFNWKLETLINTSWIFNHHSISPRAYQTYLHLFFSPEILYSTKNRVFLFLLSRCRPISIVLLALTNYPPKYFTNQEKLPDEIYRPIYERTHIWTWTPNNYWLMARINNPPNKVWKPTNIAMLCSHTIQ